MLRKIQVGNLIQIFRSKESFPRFVPLKDESFGIILETDIVMTHIYWQNGRFESVHTWDLEAANNVEIVA